MKKLIYFIILGIAITSCQKNQKQYLTDSPEINLAKKGTDAYQNRDWETLRSLFADSARIYLNTWWGEEITPDEYVSQLKESSADFSEYSFSDDSFFEMIINDEGDKWVHAWLLWEGTHTNGNEIKSVVNLGWRIENEKVQMMSIIYNAHPLYEAANPAEVMDSTSVD